MVLWWVAMADRASAEISEPLAAECQRHRAGGVPAREHQAQLTLDPIPSRFPPHSAALTRIVECGFRGDALIGARERWYLKLVSGDLQGPGFHPGFKDLSDRYFLVCEGSLRTSLPELRPGLSLTYAANTFTLPCTHHFYPQRSTSRADARRITGVYGYRMSGASLVVHDSLSAGDEHFELSVDVQVESKVEPLHLRGRVAGELSGWLRVFECGEPRGDVKRKHIQPEVCMQRGQRPRPEGPEMRPVAPKPKPTPTPPVPRPTSKLRYYTTCGDNVCRDGGYRGPFPGIPRCAGEKEGRPCEVAGEQCDLANDCNMLLVCAERDPSTRCPR